ncbi:hypothetical protein GW950_01095, partial [Candidatus Wolfebacteria bacterium]|nr:hypothetical protein [Candidatus Wolfebacteria bacterium]
GGSNSSNYSLVLPDILDNCNNGGGVANASSKWDLLEDNHLLFELATTTDDVTLTSEDFVTIGFYSLAQSGGGSQRFKLVGLDRNKYYYQESTPTHQPPNAPNNFELSLNESNSKLRIIWDKVDDTDTLDGLITYEINYTTGDLLDENNWTDEFDTNLNTGEAAEISGRAFAKIFVESNSTYLIGVRAKDEFNNYSNTSTIAYEVSEISPPYGLSGVTWKVDPEAPTGSSVLSFTADAYPFISSTTPSAMIFFLNQDSPSSYEFNNTTDRWNVGGDNRFLKLRYNNCYYGNDENLGGLFMYHEDNCPSGTGISKRAITTDLSIGQSSFDIDVLGAFNIDNDHEFSASDYITIGFYTLQGNRFKEVAAYNTKTYYQE